MYLNVLEHIKEDKKELEEAKKTTLEDFKKIKMDELLTMNRKTGFYEMIEIMIRKLKNVEN